jgi:hypothetical protein
LIEGSTHDKDITYQPIEPPLENSASLISSPVPYTPALQTPESLVDLPNDVLFLSSIAFMASEISEQDRSLLVDTMAKIIYYWRQRSSDVCTEEEIAEMIESCTS